MAHDRPGLRQRAEALLEKAVDTPAGDWHITAEEHGTMVALADAFSLQLPVAAFRTSQGAAHFLRLVLIAMRR
jgi:hypothetical protein